MRAPAAINPLRDAATLINERSLSLSLKRRDCADVELSIVQSSYHNSDRHYHTRAARNECVVSLKTFSLNWSR